MSPLFGLFYAGSGFDVKRAFDLGITLLMLVPLAPIAVFVALLVRWKLGSPVLFRQERPGLHAEPFDVLKFRTMTDDRALDGTLLPDSERLTAFGRFLRSSSLDELPGLINVLKGEMSLVGPRPLLMRYVPLYSPFQARRHEVRPGVTGWAQINGRNAIGWDEKFSLDVWYVDNRTMWLDLKIMIATVLKVVHRDGINAVGEATMPAFVGNRIEERLLSDTEAPLSPPSQSDAARPEAMELPK